MKGERLHFAILRMASWLAPEDQRTEWLEDWRAELWYVGRGRATRFCMGAFWDALWLRRNNLNPVTGPLIHPESPLRCLALLAAVAAAVAVLAIRVLGAKAIAGPSTPGPIPGLITGAALFFLGLPAATALAMNGSPSGEYSLPWTRKLLWWIFLALKIALVQPVMICGSLVLVRVPMAPCAFWVLALRWVLIDQRRRCPVCLRLLTNPVRVGTPSATFLEWYGAESLCSRGHGLLHDPEISNSYCGTRQWLRLDSSWSGLSSQAAGARR